MQFWPSFPAQSGLGEPGVPRPDSPTYQKLRTHRDIEQSGGPYYLPEEPAGLRAMNPEQAACAEMFRNNIKASDPTGVLGNNGEFTQTFRREGDKVVANGPLRYFPGNRSFIPDEDLAGASQFFHSHPRAPHHPDRSFPSYQDYLTHYILAQDPSNTVKSGMIYHPHTDTFQEFKGKIDPETNLPKYKEAVNLYPMDPPQGGIESERRLP